MFNSKLSRQQRSPALISLLTGFVFAWGGGGIAQAQTVPCSSSATPGWTINNPSLDDQRAITDLLSGYAWAIDDRDASAFVALFVQSGASFYELCNGGGINQVFKLTFGNQDPSKDIETEMGVITKDLEDMGLRTRHLVTNTLFNEEKEDTVTTKSTVLVIIQDSNLATPDLDYSADVRGKFVEVSGAWKIQELTVYADNAPALTKKR